MDSVQLSEAIEAIRKMEDDLYKLRMKLVQLKHDEFGPDLSKRHVSDPQAPVGR